MKPEVGKTYKFYDSGKMSYTRQFDATVLRIISKEEAKSIMFPLYVGYHGERITYVDKDDPIDGKIMGEGISLYDVWQDRQDYFDDTYAKDTDCFVESSIPEYDDDTIWFVRTIEGGWFSLDIQSDWQSGILDVDNHLTEELDRLMITLKYLDKRQ